MLDGEKSASDAGGEHNGRGGEKEAFRRVEVRFGGKLRPSFFDFAALERSFFKITAAVYDI